MLISTAQNFKKSLLTPFDKKVMNNQKGFSLMEIMVALFLITLVLALVTIGGKDPAAKALDETVDKLSAAVRFTTNEAILRNSVVRLKFNPLNSPTEYTVESGPKENFVLPDFSKLFANEENLSLSDEEKRDKLLQKIGRQFVPVKEFADDLKSLSKGVIFWGMATNLRPFLIRESEVALYIYPTGERDSALIVIGNDYKVVGLTISPFTDEIDIQYKDIPEGTSDFETRVESTINSFFDSWNKGN